jgi:putative flippase GtrA
MRIPGDSLPAGVVTAFLITRQGVFSTRRHSLLVDTAWLTLVNLLAVAQTLAISPLLADLVLPEVGILTYRKTLAHAVDIAVPAVTRYFGYRYWTFSKKAA